MRFTSILMALFLAASVLAADAPARSERRIVDQWYLAVHTIADAHSLQTSIEAYYLDNKHFPAASSVEELRKFIEPTYIRTTPLNDAWGTPYLYRVSADGQSYTIASAGSDKKFDESSWSAGYSTSSKDDLVYQPKLEREWVVQRICQ